MEYNTEKSGSWTKIYTKITDAIEKNARFFVFTVPSRRDGIIIKFNAIPKKKVFRSKIENLFDSFSMCYFLTEWIFCSFNSDFCRYLNPFLPSSSQCESWMPKRLTGWFEIRCIFNDAKNQWIFGQFEQLAHLEMNSICQMYACKILYISHGTWIWAKKNGKTNVAELRLTVFVSNALFASVNSDASVFKQWINFCFFILLLGKERDRALFPAFFVVSCLFVCYNHAHRFNFYRNELCKCKNVSNIKKRCTLYDISTPISCFLLSSSSFSSLFFSFSLCAVYCTFWFRCAFRWYLYVLNVHNARLAQFFLNFFFFSLCVLFYSFICSCNISHLLRITFEYFNVYIARSFAVCLCMY